MPHRSKCALCERRAVQNWSLFNGEVAVVAPLCADHGDYLNGIVEVVGPKPSPATGLLQSVSRAPRVTPLEWTPPES